MKIKKCTYLIYVLLLFGFDNSKQISPETLIQDLTKHYYSHKSISYYVEYKTLSSGCNTNLGDTIYIKADCNLHRLLIDSTIIELFWYKANTGREVFINIDEAYVIEHNKRSIKKYYGKNLLKTKLGNIADKVINTYFFQLDFLKNFVNDKLNKITLVTDVKDNNEYWKLTILFPDQKDPFVLSEMQLNLWIEKDKKLISNIDFSVKLQDLYLYEHWSLSNIQFDSFEIRDLEKRIDSLSKIYQVINADSSNKEKMLSQEIIKSGEQINTFSGFLYQKNKNIYIDYFKNKLILFDFWYLSCAPCIKAIPNINYLYKKYKEKGLVVLGINSKDNPKDNSLLDNFIKKKNINYPLLFVDTSVDSSFQVHTYPTFYLIDKDYKIIYNSVGFNENDIDSLEFYIKKYLKIK